MFPFAHRVPGIGPCGAHRQLRGIHSPRLGVESMEGRLMLSATSADVTVSEPPIAQFDSPTSQVNYANRQLDVVSTPGDGGYINANPFPVLTFHTNGLSSDVSADVNEAENFADWTIPRSAAFGSNGSIQLSDTAFYSGGLQPVVITLSNNNLSGQFGSDTLIINPTETTPSPDEGGAIPIHTIGAVLRQETSLVSSDTSSSTLSADTTAGAHSSARATHSSQTAIAGEWARAVIFEFAGGEPGTSGHLGLRDQRAPSQDGRTTSDKAPGHRRRIPTRRDELKRFARCRVIDWKHICRRIGTIDSARGISNCGRFLPHQPF